MSRSYRKSPAGALSAAKSDKPFKVEANRKLRHKNNRLVREMVGDPEAANEKVLAIVDEVANAYDAPKDGKGYWPEWQYGGEDWFIKLLRK